MEKLGLERSLESTLSELNVPFSRRIYFEEIQAGASVDDSFSDGTAEEYDATFKESSPEIRLTAAIMKSLIFSPFQYRASFDECPFVFMRSSGELGGLVLRYEVASVDRAPPYENKVDRLIKEGKIEWQCCSVYDSEDAGRELSVVNVAMVGDPEIPRIDDVRFLDEELIERFMPGKIDPLRKAELLGRLEDRKRYRQGEICRAIIDFMK